MIRYSRIPTNDKNEIHICVRCSNTYAKYAPVVFYSILHNNPGAHVYIYVFTDFMSDERWQNIKSITGQFPECEIHKIIPKKNHLNTLKKSSNSYHGWDLIHISIFYEEYLPFVKYCFNIGIDTFCVGDLRQILRHATDSHHLVGACTSTRHQSGYSLTPKTRWMGFDTALINFHALRIDKISPLVLIRKSIAQLGYIHDEVAFNSVGKRLFLEYPYHYLYTGAYRPNKFLKPKTVIIDFYSELKPWDVAVSGYEIFDRYIEYYNLVAQYIKMEYDLPKDFKEVSINLKNRKFRKAYWYPIRFGRMSRLIFRFLLVPTYVKKIIAKII